MFECDCGFVCGHVEALRAHRKVCMAYTPPKPEAEPEQAQPDRWDFYLGGQGGHSVDD